MCICYNLIFLLHYILRLDFSFKSYTYDSNNIEYVIRKISQEEDQNCYYSIRFRRPIHTYYVRTCIPV